MRRYFFLLKLRLSLVKDLFLLSADAFLFSYFLIDYFLLATTGLLVPTFDAPSSSSTIHVNSSIYLLVDYEGSLPLVVVAAPYYDFEMRRATVCHLYNLEVAIELVALALDGSVDFDAVVANFKLLIKVPKLGVAAWTLDLLLLLSAAHVHLGRNLYSFGDRHDWTFRVLVGAMSVSTIACLIANSSD